MRFFSGLLALRLLALFIFPDAVLAAESDTTSALQTKNKNFFKIENEKIIKIEENNQEQVIFVKTPKNPKIEQIAPADLKKKVEKKSARQARLDSYKPPEGKIEILVTGYSSTVDQCDSSPFTTASGTRVHKGTMACPPQYPFGAKIEIEGMGTYTCEDRGGKIKGNHFDMWFETRGQALQWGKRTVLAEIKK